MVDSGSASRLSEKEEDHKVRQFHLSTVSESYLLHSLSIIIMESRSEEHCLAYLRCRVMQIPSFGARTQPIDEAERETSTGSFPFLGLYQ